MYLFLPITKLQIRNTFVFYSVDFLSCILFGMYYIWNRQLINDKTIILSK